MKLVKLAAAAKAVGLTAYALRAGTRRGEYPFAFVGGRYLYDLDALEATLRERMTHNQTAAEAATKQRG